mmetsp:Transcript_27106/g.41597  ORF Transcript_27106/g.41597 Transcript_27106/m.41597 type:complete len:90 (+) Transcript_27106:1918-2187(+)
MVCTSHPGGRSIEVNWTTNKETSREGGEGEVRFSSINDVATVLRASRNICNQQKAIRTRNHNINLLLNFFLASLQKNHPILISGFDTFR